MQIFDSNKADIREAAPGLRLAKRIIAARLDFAWRHAQNGEYSGLAHWADVAHKLELWLDGYDVNTPKLLGVRRGTEHLSRHCQEMIAAPIDDLAALQQLAISIDDDDAAVFGTHDGIAPLSLLC